MSAPPLAEGSIETELSPDGRFVALTLRIGGNADIWLLEAARGQAADGESLEAGQPVPLFTAPVADVVPPQGGYVLSYDVSPDGNRFLMNTVVEEPTLGPMIVVLYWKPAP